MSILALVLYVTAMAVIAVFLVGMLVKSITDERRTAGVRKIWRNFGLSIAFCILFFGSWAAQGIAQWQDYVNEQREHNEAVVVGNYIAQFSRSTLENWQSEFVQLFSFVVLSAVWIHRGSAESKDSDDRMEAALRRIEEKLGTKS